MAAQHAERANRDPAKPVAKPATEHSMAAVHVLHLAELVERWQVSGTDLLAEFGLTRDTLSEPSARVSIPLLIQLTERARALTGEPALGLYQGLQMRTSAHGYVGFAAMTASTLREALDIGIRFTPTRTTALGFRLELHDGCASVVLDEYCDLGPARDAIVFSVLIGLWSVSNAITGQELRGELELAFPEPAYFARFEELIPGEVRFARPAHRTMFDAKLLDLPLVQADPVAWRLACEQCERELDALGYTSNWLARARAALVTAAGNFRSLDELAAHFATSPRTLKRKLADQRTTYSELLDEARHGRALHLLGAGLPIDEVADRLGYSDAANFTRAFRRWTGKSPKQYRLSSAPGTSNK